MSGPSLIVCVQRQQLQRRIMSVSKGLQVLVLVGLLACSLWFISTLRVRMAEFELNLNAKQMLERPEMQNPRIFFFLLTSGYDRVTAQLATSCLYLQADRDGAVDCVRSHSRKRRLGLCSSTVNV